MFFKQFTLYTHPGLNKHDWCCGAETICFGSGSYFSSSPASATSCTCEMTFFSESYVFLSMHIYLPKFFIDTVLSWRLILKSIKFLCLTGVGAETPLRLRLRSKVSAPCGSGSTALSLIVLVMRNAHSYLHTSYSRDLYLGPPTYFHSLPPLENYI
jgi:hypothetical protein